MRNFMNPRGISLSPYQMFRDDLIAAVILVTDFMEHWRFSCEVAELLKQFSSLLWFDFQSSSPR